MKNLKNSLRKKMTLQDMSFLTSFEDKNEALNYAEKLRAEKKYDAVRTHKAICYGGKKIFYRVYIGYYSYYA
jgi:hypothetical protein